VPLGVESRGEREHLGRTEFDAKATGFATLYHDRNTSFCHGTPTLEVFGTPKRLDNYVVHLSQWGVTGITGTRDAAQGDAALENQCRRVFLLNHCHSERSEESAGDGSWEERDSSLRSE
ncbi:MAG TPA: hypothetical protein VK828_18390, partial [Terriglobales bacterium]|nr:hypothetical protein [Terriglobales bacterium]